MKRLIWLFPALIVLCISNARAQETPQVEISGGYSYLAANLNGAHFYLNGGGASATQNLNSWFGGRLEFNAYSGNDAGTVVTAQTTTMVPFFPIAGLAGSRPSLIFSWECSMAARGI